MIFFLFIILRIYSYVDSIRTTVFYDKKINHSPQADILVMYKIYPITNFFYKSSTIVDSQFTKNPHCLQTLPIRLYVPMKISKTYKIIGL